MSLYAEKLMKNKVYFEMNENNNLIKSSKNIKFFIVFTKVANFIKIYIEGVNTVRLSN